MQHSTWDLEVHAREMQRRRLHEADRARQIEMARQRGDHRRVRATQFSISRLINTFRGYLSPRRSSVAGAAPARAAALLPLSREEERPSAAPRAGGLSQPYAGMMVLARGTGAQSAAQPCATADC